MSKLRTGIDDGPPLPKSVINAWKLPQILAMRKVGNSLRSIAKKFDVSHQYIADILNKNGIK